MNSAPLPPIPLETAKAAQAVFGRSNFYLAIGDQTNRLFDGLRLADPSESDQNLPHNFATLYLITIFQYVEILPDPQAADALRERLDWKYALHLPLNYPGMEPASLCGFRRRLMLEPANKQNLGHLLARLGKVTDFFCRSDATPEACQVVSVVCEISCLAGIWEAFKQALEALAANRPAWLLSTSRPYWYGRYGSHHRNLNLREDPGENQALAELIGADGMYLLDAITKAGDPELGDLTAIRTLREVWEEQYETIEGKAIWRKNACATCALPRSLPRASVRADPLF